MTDLDPVASVLVRGPMPLSQSAKIVSKVCELLAPMHDRRRAHLSITPDNVFFRHIGADLTVQLREVSYPSPRYATPERVRGRPEGPSSDVYCLGVLFFHMITGQPPFDSGSAEEILDQHLNRAPPALAYNDLQDIPIELEQLVRAMLAKDPGRRPGVRQIVHDIDNLDLDSTVMGVRIQAALVADPNDTETPDLDTSLLQNVKIELESRTDPHLVDPYADTLIKNRSDFGLDELDELDGAKDTFLNLQAPRKTSLGWNEDPTRILDQNAPQDLISDEATAAAGDPLPPTAAMRPATETSPADEGQGRSRLLFGLGLFFFLAALLTLTLVMLR